MGSIGVGRILCEKLLEHCGAFFTKLVPLLREAARGQLVGTENIRNRHQGHHAAVIGRELARFLQVLLNFEERFARIRLLPPAPNLSNW